MVTVEVLAVDRALLEGVSESDRVEEERLEAGSAWCWVVTQAQLRRAPKERQSGRQE